MLLRGTVDVLGVASHNFTRVSRLTCRSCDDGDAWEVDVDVHTGVFPVKRGSKLDIVLATADDDHDKAKLLESCEYCTRGRVFYTTEDNVYVSFSGLMMRLHGVSIRGRDWEGGDRRVLCYVRRTVA